MSASAVVHGGVGLLPVLCFLGVLLYYDSYKLVRPRPVLAVVGCGVLIGVLAYYLNGAIAASFGLPFRDLTRYVAPVTEELLKAAVIVALIRMHRIGFVVDAGIFGFAVGTGFATFENLVYLSRLHDAGLGLWILRGFGTALMHGGATALFAMVAIAAVDAAMLRRIGMLLGGMLVAMALHSAYNHFFFSPLVSMIGIVLVLPPLLLFAFSQSEDAVGHWVGEGFDANSQMLEMLDSDDFANTTIGRYLRALKDRFDGPVVADMFCYLRIHTELAMRAKGLLILRESGFDAPLDPDVPAKFAELDYLTKSIGPTGLLALHQHLAIKPKDLWQLYMLKR